MSFSPPGGAAPRGRAAPRPLLRRHQTSGFLSDEAAAVAKRQAYTFFISPPRLDGQVATAQARYDAAGHELADLKNAWKDKEAQILGQIDSLHASKNTEATQFESELKTFKASVADTCAALRKKVDELSGEHLSISKNFVETSERLEQADTALGDKLREAQAKEAEKEAKKSEYTKKVVQFRGGFVLVEDCSRLCCCGYAGGIADLVVAMFLEDYKKMAVARSRGVGGLSDRGTSTSWNLHVGGSCVNTKGFLPPFSLHSPRSSAPRTIAISCRRSWSACRRSPTASWNSSTVCSWRRFCRS